MASTQKGRCFSLQGDAQQQECPAGGSSLEGDAQLDCRCRALGCEQDGIHAKRKVFLVAGRCPATRMPRRRIVVGRRCPARSRRTHQTRFVWFMLKTATHFRGLPWAGDDGLPFWVIAHTALWQSTFAFGIYPPLTWWTLRNLVHDLSD